MAREVVPGRSVAQQLQPACSRCLMRQRGHQSLQRSIWLLCSSKSDTEAAARIDGGTHVACSCTHSASCSYSVDEENERTRTSKQLNNKLKRQSSSNSPGVPTGGHCDWRWLCASAAAPGPLPVPPGPARFCYWIDEPALWMNSQGPGHLLDKALTLLGGRRTGSDAHFQRNAEVDPQSLGHQHLASWDLLWSSRKVCMLAAPKLRPGQVISNVPGLYMLTLKREVVLTLRSVFGDDLGGIMPPTFLVPGEVDKWRAHIREEGEDVVIPGDESSHLWMLKSLSGLGRGLQLVSALDGPSRVGELNRDNKRPFVVAQKYIGDPLLITGRKFHIRAWMLVTGVNPLRGYLYRKGLLLFSSADYAAGATHTAAGAVAPGHITNRHQNADSWVWSFEQFRRFVGPDRWNDMWYQMQELSGVCLSAGLKQLLKAKRLMQTPPNSDFHLLGLDFMVDSAHKVWLLELNSNPSLSASHRDPAFQQLLHSTKWAMLLELLQLVLLRFDMDGTAQQQQQQQEQERMDQGAPSQALPAQQPAAAAAAAASLHQGLALAQLELHSLVNFVPLMPFFPLPPSPVSFHIPWQPSDIRLGEVVRRLVGEPVPPLPAGAR